jgi:predicted ribosome quality control (RQC) complex YloA/Tae2 family protein
MEQSERQPKAVNRNSKSRQEISSLDIRFLVKEWPLAGAFIRKIYHAGSTQDRQPTKERRRQETPSVRGSVNRKREWKILLEIFIPQRGASYLHVSPSYITLNKNKGLVQNMRKEGGKAAFGPGSPSGFCMFLRKHLSGKRIERLEQHGFDRILEISAGGVILILEFVPPGNVIVTDPEGTILAALRTKKWRDREIRVRSLYQHPPGRPDPFSMGFQEFGSFFRSDKKAVVILASELGLGSGYANMLCSEAGVRPDKAAKGLEERELRSLFAKLPTLGRIEQQEQFVEVTDKDKEKLERIEAQRKEALEKWKAEEKSAKEKADAIYRKFDTVQAVLEKFSSRKESGFEPIQRKEGLHITVNLDGIDVPLDLKKSGQENAAFYYEQAKKARRKVAGIEASLQNTDRRRQETPSVSEAPEKQQEYPDTEMHKDWRQKFKWFTSSDGMLVIAGKNAEQNEILLKSYAEPEEWCFHADIQGAAFTVIKSGAQTPPGQTMKEASEFAAVNSKAWTKGYGTASVFSVQRKSLSKNPPTGMNLPAGSFVVYGQKTWYRNIPLRIAVGADAEGRILAGPESAVRKSCPYFVVLTPGSRKASDLSRDIKSRLLSQAKPRDLPALQKLLLDELARRVPFGTGEIAGK